MTKLEAGLKCTVSMEVTEAKTAAKIGSGSLAVLATPVMCALMEEAACAAIDPTLEEGMTSVGISLNITHERATRIGDTVSATATLTSILGPKFHFLVEARDSKGIIGQGCHERFMVNEEKFMTKVNAK